MRTAALIGLLGILTCTAGCNGPGIQPPHPMLEVDAVKLIIVGGSPMNLDGAPGLDGLGVEVFFCQGDDLVTVCGELDLIMFPGKVSLAGAGEVKPLHTWTFDGEQLARFVIQSRGLWGYGMTLLWGTNVPKVRTITLLARYRAPKSAPLYSRPIPIAMGPL